MLFKGSSLWPGSYYQELRASSIYGPVMDGGRWRIGTNQELYQLCGENDIVKFCKLRVDSDGQDMSYARMTMIYPGESSSASQKENAPEGDPGCVGKMEWRKM